MSETPALYDTMENYTGINVEGTKMDFFTLPDFEPDGLEAWGLNSYRYTLDARLKTFRTYYMNLV